jgi:arylsulfatase A-like enzyme
MIHYVLPESLKSDLKFDLKFDHKSDKWKAAYIESMKRISQEGTAAATDSALSLIMIHFPAPHFPYVYDRRKDDFTFESGVNYFDNLELVDRTFRDLRRVMERAGWWDDTVVLVSSDHWWKFYQWETIQPLTEEEKSATSEGIDYRVPFMLKLKRQRENVIYNPPFNTVLSQDLLLALLRGELSTPSDVTAWLDRHRSIGKSPYY